MKHCSTERQKELKKQINGKFNNVGSTDGNKYKKSLQEFLPLSEPEIQGFLHPAPVNLGYFLVWSSLSSCPQNSLKVLLL
jgi:hypothetical protein